MSLRVRKLVEKAADLLGYDAIPKYMTPARPTAQRLRALFEICRIERVIDVGANRGQYRNFLRFDMEFAGPIVSFEPDPELVAIIRQRAIERRDPSWSVHELALGRAPGRATFNRMKQRAYNSFLTPRDYDGHDPNNAVDARFEVEVRRLDDMLGELGDLSRTFIKLDTQGFDLEVFAGGPAAFRQAPLVQTEISFFPIYEGCPTWIESIQAFEAVGFRPADIFVIADSLKGGLPVEADCILMRPQPGAA